MTYQPPSPKSMQQKQNSAEGLQLLAAQRIIYSRAKRFLSIRLIGMFIIAIVAPVVGSIWPDLAVICGAVAGLWIFVGRTYLTARQLKEIDRGAAVQEKFDSLVFGMPDNARREHVPSLEDLEKLTGAAPVIKRTAKLEKLKDWYPFADGSDGLVSVAICQRANVSYSDSLLRTTAKVWRGGIVAWFAVALVLCFALDVGFSNLLLVVVLPLLPAFLDLVDFTRGYESASHVRSSTADEIEGAIAEPWKLSPSQLLVWQERIYELRRTTPLVPDVIYWMQRKRNERAMRNVAVTLSGSKD